MRTFLRPLCPPTGRRSLCPGQQNPLCETTAIAEVAGLNQQGSLFMSPWHQPAHYCQGGRHAYCCSFPGGDAAAVWQQTPMPSTRVCRNHTIPVGEGSSHLSSVIIGILDEEAEDQDPFEVVGSSMMTAHLFRHPSSDKMYIDLLTCTMRVVDLGLSPTAEDCPTLTLEEMPDSDWSPILLPHTWWPFTHQLSSTVLPSGVFTMMSSLYSSFS